MSRTTWLQVRRIQKFEDMLGRWQARRLSALKATESGLGLRPLAEAFRTPTVTLVQPLILLAPTRAPATGAEQRRIVIADHPADIARISEASICTTSAVAIFA